MTETKNIANWNTLFLLLGVEDADVQRIRQDNPGASLDQQEEIIKAWLNKGSASWAMLVGALRHKLMERGADANRIAKAYPSKDYNPEDFHYDPILYYDYICVSIIIDTSRVNCTTVYLYEDPSSPSS